MDNLILFIATILQVMVFVIFARAIMSFFPVSPGNQLANVLFRITEPILAPFRQIIPRIGMFDLSPMVAIIVLSIVGRMLCG